MSSAAPEWVRAWRPAVPGIHEVFHAWFVDHVYPPHTDDTWTVFIVDEGAVRYDLESRHHGVTGARVTILPPHVVHDGRAAGTDGYRKRVLYVGTDVLPERSIGPAVDHPEVADPAVVRGVLALHRSLREPNDALEAETQLAVVGARRARSASSSTSTVSRLSRSSTRRVSSTSLARSSSGRSPGRSGSHPTGTSWLAGSMPLAPASSRASPSPTSRVGVGFHDQAHLTRHFRRHVGTTPARYARGLGAIAGS